MDTPCKLWEGATTNGYGVINVYRNGTHRNLLVHRWAWEKEKGSIPEKMQVCHRCDVRNCYEITHLFLGTQAENLKDMASKGRGRGKSTNTHCAWGHELTPENVYENPNGARDCKICKHNSYLKSKGKLR